MRSLTIPARLRQVARAWRWPVARAWRWPVLLAVPVLVLGALALVVPLQWTGTPATALSQGKPATASSVENAGLPASAAVDGSGGTRWASAPADPQWLQVDLGATANVSQVVLRWAAGYATAFQIQVSPDATSWTSIYATSTGTGGTQTLSVSGTGRYVRLSGTARGTPGGYSLWEFQVFGAFAGCGGDNAALGQPATASSVESADVPASAAVDGNDATRWASAYADPQWLQVDLGSVRAICQVVLKWDAAYATAFQIEVSGNATSWTSSYTTTTGTGGTQTLDVTALGRFLRVSGTARGSASGYSLRELIVHTSAGPTLPGGGDLGPNVFVFDPSMPGATIQSRLDTIFAEQERSQFGSQRYALLFKPGSYHVTANIGFYTSIAGLGRSPDDVTIEGGVNVDAGWFNGNATQNFWRSAENLAVNGADRWAVSQAAPLRRVHIRGDLNLAPTGNGWASGGYLADSKVDGTVQPYSQQQWFTRDSQIGGWHNGVWNMVFSGVVGAPAQSFPQPPYTVLPQSPLTREKPFLYLDSAGAYQVFVPALRHNTRGDTWSFGAATGASIPLSEFYVAKPADGAATLNAALRQGLNLLFTPGIYHLDQTITVTRPDTVVLGLGYPTLVPDNGIVPMSVADVDGVKLAGLLFDAGTVNSPVLLRVGPDGASAGHAANPASIQDVYFRVGGAGPGQATNSLVVNSSNVIIDHVWAWRADHGAGVGWTVNPADTGLVVNGADVIAYGLFVEHYQRYEVVWNGERGRTIFFQNEMPYDPPVQAAWRSDGNGYAAYLVASRVTDHEAWGMGSYCFFNIDPTIIADHGFEVPHASGVRLHGTLTVSLAGKGTIAHVINSEGGPAQGAATVPSNVVNYP